MHSREQYHQDWHLRYHLWMNSRLINHLQRVHMLSQNKPCGSNALTYTVIKTIEKQVGKVGNHTHLTSSRSFLIPSSTPWHDAIIATSDGWAHRLCRWQARMTRRKGRTLVASAPVTNVAMPLACSRWRRPWRGQGRIQTYRRYYACAETGNMP